MIVLMVMIWLYRSIDFEGIQLDAPAVFSSVSAGVLLQAVSIGFIALISKVDTAATVAITLPYLLRLVVVDPLAEELCFRGVSLTVLERRGLPFWGRESHPGGAIRGVPFQYRAVGICFRLRLGSGRPQAARWNRFQRCRTLRLQPVRRDSRSRPRQLGVSLAINNNGVPIIWVTVYRCAIISLTAIPQVAFKIDRIRHETVNSLRDCGRGRFRNRNWRARRLRRHRAKRLIG